MPASDTNRTAAPTKVRSREHPVEIQTRVELVKMGYRELTGGTLASAGAAVAFGLATATQYATPRLWWWLGAMVALSAARLWLSALFNKAHPSPDEYRTWGLWYVIATTLTATGWGLSVWLFPLLEVGQPLAVVHVLVLAGLVTGSTRMLLPMRKGSVAYLLAVMAPLAVRFFSYADVTGVTLGICVILFTIYTASATLHNHRTLSGVLALRFEREAVAAELSAENARRQAYEIELREARERAESASRAKGEFLATISHEIRTPMNGVLGMLRIVNDTPLSPEQRDYLKTASDSAEALLVLLNDVLDFSKIEAGRLELDPANFSPSLMVRAVADLMLSRARDKGLRFDVKLGDNLPSAVVGDAARIRQILVNLIGNAIKFTERGRIEFVVDCPERTATRAMMHFTITDTGIGIDSAALERLFKPFSQADSSMSRRYGGTGLGLAISMRLAEAMGGALQVQSAPNQGSTFRLIVPCPLPDLSSLPRTSETPTFVTPVLSGRVLVVEDDSVNQQVIELFLRKMNVTPSFAPDGEAAITSATTEDFEVVLMDCQLPGIDGLEATRRIRRKLGSRPLKIIALTANASTHAREACLSAGMDDYLTKPVRFELLARVLQKYLPAVPASARAAE